MMDAMNLVVSPQDVTAYSPGLLDTCLQGLVHVARKMPKNAHAHFILGLMYQRLGQPQKVA